MKDHSTGTNNRDDNAEVAEGLGQESAMHRFVLACLVLALMSQGVYGESEDHARLIGAVSGFEQTVTDSIDLNTNQAAESYALLATAAELTPGWRELGRLALDTINSVVGIVCDLDDLLTSEGGTKAMEDPITFKKILNEVWMSKDPLACLASKVSLLGLVMSADSYKISFQAISDVEQLARDVYSVDQDFSSASNAARNELWSPSKQNGLPIPLRNGPRLKEGGRNVATQWENGIGPVRQEIKSSIDNFILGIPDPLPKGYPLEKNIAYLNDLSSQIRRSGFHIVNFRSIEADESKTLHVCLGMVKEDREAASFLYDSWLNNLDVQFTSTIVDTGETICDVTSYGAKGTVKTVSSGLSDLYDIKGIIQVPEEIVNLIDKPINPLDALQDHTIKTNIDLIQETSNLWTLSAFTLDYLAKSMEMSSNHIAEVTAPDVLGFGVSPRKLSLGESFTINYTVSDTSGSGLKQIELWRKDEQSDWQEIDRYTLSQVTDSFSGSFTDSPSSPGKYWYGVHVVDNAGNWNDQMNSNTNGQPSSFEPVEVEVISSQEVTLTLYVHDGSADGPVLSGVEVTGQDAAGSSFSQTTDANGLVVITGSPGNWQFTATKAGYTPNSWSQEITETCTKHAFLSAEGPTTEPETVDISGHWAGELYQSSRTFIYSLDLTQTGSGVSGTSQISTGSYYAIMDLSGSFSNGILTFTETRIREHLDPPGSYFILKTGNLNYAGTPTQLLEGNWECYDSMTVPCNYAPPGSISVTKGV